MLVLTCDESILVELFYLAALIRELVLNTLLVFCVLDIYALDIKTEVNHIAIFNNVVFAF